MPGPATPLTATQARKELRDILRGNFEGRAEGSFGALIISLRGSATAPTAVLSLEQRLTELAQAQSDTQVTQQVTAITQALRTYQGGATQLEAKLVDIERNLAVAENEALSATTQEEEAALQAEINRLAREKSSTITQLRMLVGRGGFSASASALTQRLGSDSPTLPRAPAPTPVVTPSAVGGFAPATAPKPASSAVGGFTPAPSPKPTLPPHMTKPAPPPSTAKPTAFSPAGATGQAAAPSSRATGGTTPPSSPSTQEPTYVNLPHSGATAAPPPLTLPRVHAHVTGYTDDSDLSAPEIQRVEQGFRRYLRSQPIISGGLDLQELHADLDVLARSVGVPLLYLNPNDESSLGRFFGLERGSSVVTSMNNGLAMVAGLEGAIALYSNSYPELASIAARVNRLLTQSLGQLPAGIVDPNSAVDVTLADLLAADGTGRRNTFQDTALGIFATNAFTNEDYRASAEVQNSLPTILTNLVEVLQQLASIAELAASQLAQRIQAAPPVIRDSGGRRSPPPGGASSPAIDGTNLPPVITGITPGVTDPAPSRSSSPSATPKRSFWARFMSRSTGDLRQEDMPVTNEDKQAKRKEREKSAGIKKAASTSDLPTTGSQGGESLSFLARLRRFFGGRRVRATSDRPTQKAKPYSYPKHKGPKIFPANKFNTVSLTEAKKAREKEVKERLKLDSSIQHAFANAGLSEENALTEMIVNKDTPLDALSTSLEAMFDEHRKEEGAVGKHYNDYKGKYKPIPKGHDRFSNIQAAQATLVGGPKYEHLRINNVAVGGKDVSMAMSAPFTEQIVDLFGLFFEKKASMSHILLSEEDYDGKGGDYPKVTDIPRYYDFVIDPSLSEPTFIPQHGDPRGKKNTLLMPPEFDTPAGKMTAKTEKVKVHNPGTPSETTEYKLTLTVGSKTHQMAILRSDKWVDMTPTEPVTLDQLLAIRREVLGGKSPSSGIVHCRAGVGRTGTLISAEAMANLGSKTNLMNTVLDIRASRNNTMVQTKAQLNALVRWSASTGHKILPDDKGSTIRDRKVEAARFARAQAAVSSAQP